MAPLEVDGVTGAIARFVSYVPVLTETTVHIICDNYATHKHEKVKAWFVRNPRLPVHFTPTSASRLNMVERFFRDQTTKSLRRDVFHKVVDLIDSIEAHITAHNDKPKAFIWTAGPAISSKR